MNEFNLMLATGLSHPLGEIAELLKGILLGGAGASLIIAALSALIERKKRKDK